MYSTLCNVRSSDTLHLSAVIQVFMKSVKLEWCLGDIKKARELLAESVKHYPNFAKVFILHCDLLNCRMRQRERLHAMGLSICLSVCLSVTKVQKCDLFKN